jgi:hypothetical protein
LDLGDLRDLFWVVSSVFCPYTCLLKFPLPFWHWLKIF